MENLPVDYLQVTLERLKKNGMGAFYYRAAREAAEEILRQIPREATVGVGGSITVREMGIPMESQVVEFCRWGTLDLNNPFVP